MRVTQEKRAENRQKILESAGRLFRRDGPDAIGVADVTRDAGLTHGGFYGHFDSKEALFAAAAKASLIAAGERIEAAAAKGASWAQVVKGYLAPQHLDDCEHGCTIAALSGDVSRRPAEVQRTFAEGLSAYLATIGDVTGSRQQALADTATMVGALVMARAVKSGNRQLCDEILAAARTQLLAR